MEVSRLPQIRGHYLMQVGHKKGMILFTAYHRLDVNETVAQTVNIENEAAHPKI